MDFTMASQLKAGKIARDQRASQTSSLNAQKGAGGKPTVTADSISISKATTAPKAFKSGTQGIHRGDARTAPKVAEFGNDRPVQSGEFESEPDASTADTAAFKSDRAGEIQSGEFESTPETSQAGAGSSWGQQHAESSGME
jgi:hypothetical protein